jgi:exodeoxyribonuclease III
MKIVSYNVNGIRAAFRKNWLAWLQATDADIVCLQEIKCTPDQLTDLLLIEQMGYQHYWHPAEKKGYSGTAIFTKHSPKHVEYGCGNADYDREGRMLRADFEDFSVMSAYFPSGSSGEHRQDFKFRFLDDFQVYMDRLKKYIPRMVVSGDYNICHRAIDIHNPKSNARSSGFLPREREWMEEYINSGFIDTFRYFNQEPHNYTWWSNRPGVRDRNLGWRIDYNMATADLEPNLKRSAILCNAMHSDHCPILLELNF